MFQKLLTAATILLSLTLIDCSCHAQAPVKGEIIYHVCERSFYDSNGDNIGDLNGLREKLGYLQQLGVTSILMLPLYDSYYYHNYFSGDFEKIDPEFGTMQDYLNLVREVHRRGMKIYMDMETQYVTEDHIWWKDSYGHPGSEYSDYILYDDSENRKPEPIIFNLTELPGYDGTIRKVATVNLLSPKVLEYNYGLFSFFVDPNKDGRFDDGVDGFRLDHMMDDLDGKGKLTQLFDRFWNPLLSRLKTLNPALKDVAEQANWYDYGKEYFSEGGVDRVFAFRLMMAILSFDKNKIAAAADTTFAVTPPGKEQVVFIENHDVSRFSSIVGENPGKERIGAAPNLLIGGVPSIYYGQELGMEGWGGNGKYGYTDANDIPKREAFEWHKSDSGKGMAIWYKYSGPWWDSTNLKPNDGVSLEEEQDDPRSLYNFYRQLIHFRNRHPEFIEGTYQTVANNNDSVFSFTRATSGARAVAVLNLSSRQQGVTLPSSAFMAKEAQLVYGDGTRSSVQTDGLHATLPPYGIAVWEIK